MNVLGIYGSPRKGGNTDRLLDEALRGAQAAGADISLIRCCDLEINGCIECGECDETGECVINDDMQSAYPLLEEADVIILASPVFFYSITAQAKALVDRCQAQWCKRRLEGITIPSRRRGRGYLIAAGATKGKSLFDGTELVARYFFDALGMTYEGGVFVKGVEQKGDVKNRQDALEEAFELGKTAAGEIAS
jgi:multimeric flavodoxin WrbA